MIQYRKANSRPLTPADFADMDFYVSKVRNDETGDALHIYLITSFDDGLSWFAYIPRYDRFDIVVFNNRPVLPDAPFGK